MGDAYDWPGEWCNDPDYYDVWIKNYDQSFNSWVLTVQYDDGTIEDVNAELDESAEQYVEITPEDLTTEQAAEEFAALCVDDWMKVQQEQGLTPTENEQLQKHEIFLSTYKNKNKRRRAPTQNRVFSKSKVGKKRPKGKGRGRGKGG